MKATVVNISGLDEKIVVTYSSMNEFNEKIDKLELEYGAGMIFLPVGFIGLKVF